MSELHHMNEWETCIAEWADRCKTLSDERDALNESCMVLRGDVNMLMNQLDERDSIIAARDAQLAALPPAVTWTTQKPTVPGWYWYRIADHERTFILYVDVMGGATACGVLRDCMRDVGEWAGPMEPPQ